jgi:hypothetical protein
MQPVSSTETSQTPVLLLLFRSCKTPVRVFCPAVSSLNINSRNSLSETFSAATIVDRCIELHCGNSTSCIERV